MLEVGVTLLQTEKSGVLSQATKLNLAILLARSECQKKLNLMSQRP